MTAEERDALCVLAHVYLQNGRAAKALPILQALHALFPQDASAASLLAWASFASGDPHGASRMVDVAVRLSLEPRQRRAVLLLKSKALWQLGAQVESRAVLAQYQHLAPEAAP